MKRIQIPAPTERETDANAERGVGGDHPAPAGNNSAVGGRSGTARRMPAVIVGVHRNRHQVTSQAFRAASKGRAASSWEAKTWRTTTRGETRKGFDGWTMKWFERVNVQGAGDGISTDVSVRRYQVAVSRTTHRSCRV